MGADERVDLVQGEQGPRIAGRLTEGGVKVRSREDEAGIGHRRLGHREGHVAGGQRSLERCDIVELDDPGAVRDPGRKAPLLGNDPFVLLDHQRRVALAVVLAVEDEDDVPAGQGPGQADHLGVRLGAGEGELPFRHPVASGEVLGDEDRVLAREQKLVAAPHPLADRLDDRGRRVAAESAHVGEVEVQIGVAVDIGERRPFTLRYPRRRVVVKVIHPGHRDPSRHGSARPLPQLHRPRVIGDEAGVLGNLEPLDAARIQSGQIDHRDRLNQVRPT